MVLAQAHEVEEEEYPRHGDADEAVYFMSRRAWARALDWNVGPICCIAERGMHGKRASDVSDVSDARAMHCKIGHEGTARVLCTSLRFALVSSVQVRSKDVRLCDHSESTLSGGSQPRSHHVRRHLQPRLRPSQPSLSNRDSFFFFLGCKSYDAERNSLGRSQPSGRLHVRPRTAMRASWIGGVVMSSRNASRSSPGWNTRLEIPRWTGHGQAARPGKMETAIVMIRGGPGTPGPWRARARRSAGEGVK